MSRINLSKNPFYAILKINGEKFYANIEEKFLHSLQKQKPKGDFIPVDVSIFLKFL